VDDFTGGLNLFPQVGEFLESVSEVRQVVTD
jgi:hypothetical protein